MKHETDRGAQGAACCWLIVTTFRRYRSHTTPFTHSQHVRRRFPVYSQSHNQHPSQLQSVSSLGKETWRLSALTPHSPRPRPGNLRPTPRGCGRLPRTPHVDGIERCAAIGDGQCLLNMTVQRWSRVQRVSFVIAEGHSIYGGTTLVRPSICLSVS